MAQLSLFSKTKKKNKMAIKKRKSVGLKADGKLKKGFKFAKGGKVVKVSAKTKSKSKGKKSGTGSSTITYAGKAGTRGPYTYTYNRRK